MCTTRNLERVKGIHKVYSMKRFFYFGLAWHSKYLTRFYLKTHVMLTLQTLYILPFPVIKISHDDHVYKKTVVEIRR